jgi:hypothetical protein
VRTLLRSSILAIVFSMTPSQVFAQRTPHADSAAVGGDIGVFIPQDDFLDNGLNLEGFYEYYISSRTSIRLGAGWMYPKFSHDDEDGFRYIRVSGDIVRNWEGGSVHPFVGAGLGVYFIQEKDNGNSFGDDHTKLGGTIFGGVEFFTSNTVSVKGEARYHLIDNINGLNPDGLALTIGLKKYF